MCLWTPAPTVDPVGQVGVKLQHTSAAPVSTGWCWVAERVTRAE